MEIPCTLGFGCAKAWLRKSHAVKKKIADHGNVCRYDCATRFQTMSNRKAITLFIALLVGMAIIFLFVVFTAGTAKELEPNPAMAPSPN